MERMALLVLALVQLERTFEHGLDAASWVQSGLLGWPPHIEHIQGLLFVGDTVVVDVVGQAGDTESAALVWRRHTFVLVIL